MVPLQYWFSQSQTNAKTQAFKEVLEQIRYIGTKWLAPQSWIKLFKSLMIGWLKGISSIDFFTIII